MMSMPLDLDEIPEKRLRAEIARREACRKNHVCDYCGRGGDTPECKERDRHMVAVLAFQAHQRHLESGRRVGQATSTVYRGQFGPLDPG